VTTENPESETSTNPTTENPESAININKITNNKITINTAKNSIESEKVKSDSEEVFSHYVTTFDNRRPPKMLQKWLDLINHRLKLYHISSKKTA
jgi:hypothetical protein